MRNIDYGCLILLIMMLIYLGLFIIFPLVMLLISIGIALMIWYFIIQADKEYKKFNNLNNNNYELQSTKNQKPRF